MKIDRLPISLLIFATCLYLTAMGGFGLLSKNYRMSVPQPTSAVLTDIGTGDDRNVTLFSATKLPAGIQEITFKYFAQGIPQYVHLEVPQGPTDTEKALAVVISGDIPAMTSDSLEGFVHLMKPIEEPLLSFLLN